MKTKKVEKVITTLKDRIGHHLKGHLTEITTQANNLNSLMQYHMRYIFSYAVSYEIHHFSINEMHGSFLVTMLQNLNMSQQPQDVPAAKLKFLQIGNF